MQNVSENSLDLINQGCALMAQQQYEQALAKFLLAQKDSPMLKEKVSKPASLRYRTQLNSFRLLLLKSTRQWVIFLHIGRVLLMTKLLPPISTNIRHC